MTHSYTNSDKFRDVMSGKRSVDYWPIDNRSHLLSLIAESDNYARATTWFARMTLSEIAAFSNHHPYQWMIEVAFPNDSMGEIELVPHPDEWSYINTISAISALRLQDKMLGVICIIITNAGDIIVHPGTTRLSLAAVYSHDVDVMISDYRTNIDLRHVHHSIVPYTECQLDVYDGIEFEFGCSATCPNSPYTKYPHFFFKELKMYDIPNYAVSDSSYVMRKTNDEVWYNDQLMWVKQMNEWEPAPLARHPEI